MNIIKDKLQKYNVDKISKDLNIPKNTIYRWAKGKNINDKKKFIELLYYLEIDPKNYIDKE